MSYGCIVTKQALAECLGYDLPRTSGLCKGAYKVTWVSTFVQFIFCSQNGTQTCETIRVPNSQHLSPKNEDIKINEKNQETIMEALGLEVGLGRCLCLPSVGVRPDQRAHYLLGLSFKLWVLETLCEMLCETLYCQEMRHYFSLISMHYFCSKQKQLKKT